MTANPNYKYTDTHVEITIHKPLFGSFVYIREAHLLRAERMGLKLLIHIPQGTFEKTVNDWYLHSTRIEKVFQRPDEPMTMIGNSVIHLKPLPEISHNIQEQLF